MQSMDNHILYGVPQVENVESFISNLHLSISNGFPHAEPVFSFKTDEGKLVQGILQMLQGHCSSLFYWDEKQQRFFVKDGIYVLHLSYTSLYSILSRFLFAGTCLKQVELYVQKVQSTHVRVPTLNAFANSITSWLKRLRDVALKEEVNYVSSDTGPTATLLGITNSLSSLCAGAEVLLQVVYGAIPVTYLQTSIPASELAVQILNHLFKKLNELCLVQGGKEEAYDMLLFLFTESLLPYLEGLDSWLYDGILDDPFEEMFFYANDGVAIDQPAFWEMSYLLREGRWRKLKSNHGLGTENVSNGKARRKMSDQEPISVSTTAGGREHSDIDDVACPIFLKDMAKAIVSAGKSLQLVRHVQDENILLSYDSKVSGCCKTSKGLEMGPQTSDRRGHPIITRSDKVEDENVNCDYTDELSIFHFHETNHTRVMGFLTLPEIFLVSMVGLLGDNDQTYKYLRMSSPKIYQICEPFLLKCNMGLGIQDGEHTAPTCGKTWQKFLADVVYRRGHRDINREDYADCKTSFSVSSFDSEGTEKAAELHRENWQDNEAVSLLGKTILNSLCPGNPVITVSREFLRKNMSSWSELNISKNYHLPPINDEKLRENIFSDRYLDSRMVGDPLSKGALPRLGRTDYAFGFQFDEREHVRRQDDERTLETLYAFPTLLPCLQESSAVSELLPFQKNSTLTSRILKWIQSNKVKDTLQPAVIIQECLSVYIREQVDHVGKHMLLRLMNDWKLLDELGVLRAIYLLGSGDLLQQFLIVTFNKLDRGDIWDDEFELNTMLQESIRNSADGALLSAPDALVVSVTKHGADNEETETGNGSTPRNARNHCFGINVLDILKFTYKVSWPLDLIANVEALKKYNQVMGFLLKVKRAKFVLDKARRWMWKGRGSSTHNYKHHLLVEQKLLHFVDAFHQYVMDRVLHSAWSELCNGMASAGSLDEVIEVHDTYLLSIQRQCFVASDKLWALIASRIKTILGLALDFYAIQQTLSSGGAAAAIKARCEMEVDRIEKQFDDCVAFLLRILSFKLNVGHFPHLADLVTRINYNYFYMSDSGNLQTVPSFETAAKPGKFPAFS
ncbi:hypothetical protein C4D60_Mb04t26970 [Musa balbisiana]|uniref:Gamma-tubulin complex component n=1 Tax=Musa balbisiana TaxID=52838 RepID=A0A4S8KF25_MUSBA|nr:hypothetical protein C4D60_Mb04t26970 [Musa balbisiana]